MTELILHHYEFSNYSEKARVAMGYKSLRWKSVIVPPVMPKLDLAPLTGGYRRAPVLQVGADISCDTRMILRVSSEPTLFRVAYQGGRQCSFGLAEGQLFLQ